MELKEIIANYLNSAKVMQLATVSNGQPWACTVHYAFDENWNLYWLSQRSTRHSQELTANSKVAGTIVKDPSVKQALQFEAIASEVAAGDLEKAHALYSERYGDKSDRLEEARSGNANQRTYYILKPTKIILFDTVNFPDNPHQEYQS